MREFSQTLTEFAKGLRSDANTPRNSGFATELYNTRCGVAGLEVPPLIAYPITGAPTVSWPLPQLIKVGALILTETGMYFARFASGTLTVSKVNSDYTLTTAFTATGINKRFTVADFGYYQIWHATGLMMKRQITEALTGYEWSVVTAGGVTPPVTCVCNFRGQLIAGITMAAAEAVGATRDNLVAWSEIGSVEPDVMFDPAYNFLDRARALSTATTTFSLLTGDSGDGYNSYITTPKGAQSIWPNYQYLTIGNTGGVTFNTYVRFAAVAIPAGATITAAIVRFKSYANDSYAAPNWKVYFNDVANAVAPTTGAGVEALALDAGVVWQTSSWVLGSVYDTPTLKSQLQAIVDKSGWATGNAVMIVIRENGGAVGAIRSPRSGGWLGDEADTPTLIVTYTAPQDFPRTGTPMQPYKGTSGNYRPGPTSTVRRVLPLGNGVMVYCADKIFYMNAVSTPIATFGIIPVMDVGIPSTFAVEGNDKEHVFVTTNKDVFRLKDGKAPEYLGYREYITTLTAEIVISRNPNFNDYYISDGTKTYLLTPFGMSQWFQYPTSLVWEDANKRVIGPIAVSSDVSASMATDVFDFEVRSLKVLVLYEIGSTGQIMTGNADFKYKVTDSSFTASRFKTANNYGMITPLVAGTEFKMRVKGADYTKFDLDYLTVRYKYVDKRNIRGKYAKDDKVLSRTGR